MKAYDVSDRDGVLGYSIVVFAETRGKAIAYAHYKDDFCDFRWTEMSALRKPELDKYYNGKTEMDWYNMEDRIAMVKDANFQCSYEVDITLEECESCPAHEWCERYERMKEDAVN